MKVAPLSEAKSKLSRYGKLCRDEPVVVTVNGNPSFQLVPLDEKDDLIGRCSRSIRRSAVSWSAAFVNEASL